MHIVQHGVFVENYDDRAMVLHRTWKAVRIWRKFVRQKRRYFHCVSVNGHEFGGYADFAIHSPPFITQRHAAAVTHDVNDVAL